MGPDDRESVMMKKLVNLILIFAFLGFGTSVAMLANQYISFNKQGIEARWFPPTTDWTFRNWEQDEAGHWTAEVYYLKHRSECIFVSDQILTATYVNPVGDIGESGIFFVGDETEGNTRPTGWQRIDDRVGFSNGNISPGAILRGTVLHQCHEGLPTVSGFTQVVVGQDMPWPDFVQDWHDAGRIGLASDYR